MFCLSINASCYWKIMSMRTMKVTTMELLNMDLNPW